MALQQQVVDEVVQVHHQTWPPVAATQRAVRHLVAQQRIQQPKEPLGDRIATEPTFGLLQLDAQSLTGSSCSQTALPTCSAGATMMREQAIALDQLPDLFSLAGHGACQGGQCMQDGSLQRDRNRARQQSEQPRDGSIRLVQLAGSSWMHCNGCDELHDRDQPLHVPVRQVEGSAAADHR